MAGKKGWIYVALFIAVVVGYRVWSEQAGPRFDAGLAKIEADAKSKLPMKVDEHTTLVDVKYEPTKTTYWYAVDQMLDPRETDQVIRQRVCENSEMLRTIKQKGFSYEYHYAKGSAPQAVFTIATCP